MFVMPVTAWFAFCIYQCYQFTCIKRRHHWLGDGLHVYLGGLGLIHAKTCQQLLALGRGTTTIASMLQKSLMLISEASTSELEGEVQDVKLAASFSGT